MKEYLFLFRGGQEELVMQSPEQAQVHMQKWVQWMRDLQEKGCLLNAQPLDHSGRKIIGSKKIVTDGAYIEGKEMVGGYLMCKADHYDSAIEMAMSCPLLDFDSGIVEIREIKEM